MLSLIICFFGRMRERRSTGVRDLLGFLAAVIGVRECAVHQRSSFAFLILFILFLLYFLTFPII